MPEFVARLGTHDGQIVERRLESASETVLRHDLASQGYFIFQVAKTEAGRRPATVGGPRRRRVRGSDLVLLSQQMVVLIQAGMPILRILDALLDKCPTPALVPVLESVRTDVKNGFSLSQSFEKFPDVFPPTYVASVRAGEQSGDLAPIIQRYVQYQKRIEEARKKVLAALTYPIILLAVATGAVLFLVLYVVPSFSQVYAGSGQELPGATRVLLNATRVLKANIPWIIGGLVAAVLLGRQWARTADGRRRVDQALLALPGLGNVLSTYAFTKQCHVLATTLGSGIPLVPALRMSVPTLGNTILKEALGRVIKQVEEGASLSQSLDETGLCPPMMVRLVGVGEATGKVPDMLNEVAAYYQGEVDTRVGLITSIFEPVIMLVMGLVVASILVAMYLPIFNLAETIR